MSPTSTASVTYTWQDWLSILRFIALHLVCLGAFWTGMPTRALVLAVAVYALQMFAVTAVYHRYYSHRSYKMGRVARFVGAFFAQISGQRSVFWWAAVHRHHHRHTDEPEDLHSPRHGFWHSHMLWMLSHKNDHTRFEMIPDLQKMMDQAPELRLLHRFQHIPLLLSMLTCWLIAGWPGFVAFFWALIACYHITFTINSLSHIWGTQRYDTGDDSRNNPLLALLTFGEGWHNNHHHYQASARQGFFWWELDLTWYGLLALERLGIVWDLKRPTDRALSGQTPQRTA